MLYVYVLVLLYYGMFVSSSGNGFFFLRHDTAGDGYVVVNGIEVYNMCPDTTALDVCVLK